MSCNKEMEMSTFEVDKNKILSSSVSIQPSIDEKKDLYEGSYESYKGADFKSLKVKLQENQDVLEYQQTGNNEILEKVYTNRIPTLNFWANKYCHLSDSKEDLFSELTATLIKSMEGYKEFNETKASKANDDGKVETRRTHFNTYLYYALRHRLFNMYNKKRAIKRTSLGSKDPVNLLSLDFCYGDSDSDFTLMDMISDPQTETDHRTPVSVVLRETMSMITSEKDPPIVKRCFYMLSQGAALHALIKECNKKEGKVCVSWDIAKRVSKRKCNKIVSDLIRKKGGITSKFKLVKYVVKSRYIHYTIELTKSKESDILVKRIKSIRKNKTFYTKKLGWK